jgi:inward rectifier potassium channel
MADIPLSPQSPGTEAPTFDPGFTTKYTGALKRAINKDGNFNVRRTGGSWRDIHPYLFLINISWPLFITMLTAAYVVVNLCFACVYFALGVEHLQNGTAPTVAGRFLNALFFSTETFTTVGYGNIAPAGLASNTVAAFEALTGWMGFAIATGLLFGRFARPSARIGFSNTMVVSPYMEGTSLQLRIVNRRSNNLIELEASMLLMTVEEVAGRLQRRFVPLELERPRVIFFPLTWTIVHPITARSPLYGKTPEALQQMQAEVLVMIKGFDDTFGQTVYARYSYRYDEITWGSRFAPAFEIEKEGDVRVELDRVSEIEPAELPSLMEYKK